MIFMTGPTMINTSHIKYTTQRAKRIHPIFAIAFSAKKLRINPGFEGVSSYFSWFSSLYSEARAEILSFVSKTEICC